MSGPVTDEDAPASVSAPVAAPPVGGLEILAGRAAEVGGLPVTRVLPKRARRTIGAWCFVDEFGPAEAAVRPMRVGPHPHIGLQTVSWLLAGEVLHRDSLGSEQLIRPGQLNLMTAGRGIAHAEETPASGAGSLQGVQLWLALPEATRAGAPAFEHHGDLPVVEVGDSRATVVTGEFAGARSPARHDTPLMGIDLAVSGTADLPLDPTFEYGLVPLDGTLEVDGTPIRTGALAYLDRGRDELRVDGTGRALLIGGEPFESQILMWWNFVARTTDEIDDAYRQWQEESARFGSVDSGLARIGAPRPRWFPLA